MKIIAVTCARMNSTRFPGKCLYPLAGKPLLQWTIDFAKEINIPLYTFTRDQKIIDYVKDKTPIIYEPEELLDTPYNSTYEKMQYVNKILDADYVILLQPTQPVRDKDHIKICIDTVVDSNVGYGHTSNYFVDDGSFYIFAKKYLDDSDQRDCVELIGYHPTFDINTLDELKECEEWLQKQK